jgi:hypothetical protein
VTIEGATVEEDDGEKRVVPFRERVGGEDVDAEWNTSRPVLPPSVPFVTVKGVEPNVERNTREGSTKLVQSFLIANLTGVVEQSIDGGSGGEEGSGEAVSFVERNVEHEDG